jgi:hypothetical protein
MSPNIPLSARSSSPASSSSAGAVRALACSRVTAPTFFLGIDTSVEAGRGRFAVTGVEGLALIPRSFFIPFPFLIGLRGVSVEGSLDS